MRERVSCKESKHFSLMFSQFLAAFFKPEMKEGRKEGSEEAFIRTCCYGSDCVERSGWIDGWR